MVTGRSWSVVERGYREVQSFYPKQNKKVDAVIPAILAFLLPWLTDSYSGKRVTAAGVRMWSALRRPAGRSDLGFAYQASRYGSAPSLWPLP